MGVVDRLFRDAPAPPAPLAPEILYREELATPHQVFQGSIRWKLTKHGVSIEDKTPARTVGAPVTVQNILNWWGKPLRMASASYGVPIELLIATIATESAGGGKSREAAEKAERREPGFIGYNTTPNRVSVGLMQTLLSTAREALSDPLLKIDELRDPYVSIVAGTSYIKNGFKVTHYDPPLVAAAYNAGGLYQETAIRNRWRLRCYPLNTGEHIDRFILYFNDAMVVVSANPHQAEGAVSFTLALS